MILSILKIIGIILLVIICLFIFIVCMLLFVPIRYRFEGSYPETLNGVASVRWMPVFLKMSVHVKENQPEYVIKFFGGVVAANTDVKISWLGRKIRSFGKDQAEDVSDDKGTDTSKGERLQTGQLIEEPAEEIAIKDSSFNEEDTEDTMKQQCSDEPPADVPEKGKQKTSMLPKIRRFVSDLKKKWQAFQDKVKKAGKKKDALLNIYHSKRFEVAKKDVKIYLKKLLHIIKPDKLEGYLHFGMDDPATTGYILGVVAMGFPLYQGFLTIEPDFTKGCLDGRLKGRGKIFLFSIVKLALKVILNKNLKNVTKKVQTILEA